MVKANTILVLFMLLIGMTMGSCIQDDDFSVPDGLGSEENKALEAFLASGAVEISIGELKAKFAGNDHRALQIDTDVYIKGYVSSSDREGHFYKEIFIQNAPENPTDGIRIIIEQVESHNQYNWGREVYVKLKGLYIGEERVEDGLMTLGGGTATNQFGTAVKRLTQNQRAQHIFRAATTANLIPLALNFPQVSASHIGLYVQFNDVEFADHLAGKRYFDPAQDFDTLRQLQSCTASLGYAYFSLETSSFAMFKDDLLPLGNGMLLGVVTKTFDGSHLVLGLNTVNDVNMAGTRCAPKTISDFEVVFEEDFELAATNSNFDFVGWTNFSEVGTSKWREKNNDGNGYAEFSAFNSFNPSNIAWLVTPGIALDGHSHVLLNFKTAQHHLASPNNTLEVMVSTDYDGSNVLGATWIAIEAALPTQNTTWYEFVDSGLIDLSAYSGTLHVAFKVTGAGTIANLTGTYQLDDLRILVAN